MTRKYLKTGTLLALLSIGLFACQKKLGDGEILDYTNTVKSQIDTVGQFSMFKELYKFVDSLTLGPRRDSVSTASTYPLVGASLASNYITGFIPTNDAFISNGITFIKDGSLLNPLLLKFLSRDTSTINLRNPTIIRQFVANFIINRLVEPKDFNDSLLSRTISGLGQDTLYVKKVNNDFLIDGNIRIDISQFKSFKNGNLYPINSLRTPVHAATALGTASLLKIDTSLSLFNQALIRIPTTDSINRIVNNAQFQNTFLVPNNAAFRAAGFTTASIAAMPIATVTALIRHHIVVGQKIFTNNFQPGNLRMLDGTDIIVEVSPNLTFKSANTLRPAVITSSNILIARGIINIIDRVLMP
jgi:uncharacterized surface protein with fasciclin (FAS1) repeats